jgi:hypothetical protein
MLKIKIAFNTSDWEIATVSGRIAAATAGACRRKRGLQCKQDCNKERSKLEMLVGGYRLALFAN